jgi:phage tail-like protein
MATPLMNPVPVFDFSVFMMDAKPGSLPLRGVTAAVGIGKAVLFGAFSEVTGLNAEMDVEEYREGGNNTAPRKFIKSGKHPNLVFRRGVTLNADLWDWYYQVLYKTTNPIRKNGFVLLTDRGTGISALAGGPTSLGLPGLDRLPVAIWFFRNALPQKLQGPTLNAKSNEIAIETLEITHEGLYRIGASMVPGIGDAMDVVGL